MNTMYDNKVLQQLKEEYEKMDIFPNLRLTNPPSKMPLAVGKYTNNEYKWMIKEITASMTSCIEQIRRGRYTNDRFTHWQ